MQFRTHFFFLTVLYMHRFKSKVIAPKVIGTPVNSTPTSPIISDATTSSVVCSPAILTNVVSKSTIKIIEPVDLNPVEEDDIEFNSITLGEIIIPNEQCMLKITPLTGKPIIHILSANLLFTRVCENVYHQIIFDPTDPLSFSIFVENKGSDNLTVNICYAVKF